MTGRASSLYETGCWFVAGDDFTGASFTSPFFLLKWLGNHFKREEWGGKGCPSQPIRKYGDLNSIQAQNCAFLLPLDAGSSSITVPRSVIHLAGRAVD